MLGVNLNIKELIRDAYSGARDEALGKIPGYNAFSGFIRRYVADKRLKGPKSDTNTVDEYEFAQAVKHINAEISGTLNPIRFTWGLVQTLFGNSKSERFVATIKALENYGNQYDAFRFVDDAQDFLLEKIEHRIAAIEGPGSKFLGTTKEKVSHDPILQALKAAMQAWLEPYDKIINGEVTEIAKPSEDDVKRLMDIRDRIQYSSKARYIEDMLPKYDQMISQAKRALYSNGHSRSQQPLNNNRKAGEHLARTAA